MTPTRARATVVATALLLTTACGGGSDESQPARPDDDSTAEASDSEAETDSEPAVADDAASITDGSGGGTITMGEEVYVFTAVSCFPSDGNFSVEGPATNPGPFGDAWVSISADTVEDYDDDGMPDITADVTVEHGKTEMFGDGDDSAPDLYASRLSFSTQPEGLLEGSIEFSINGSTITGSGAFSDGNGVAFPFGETRAFSFQATCG